MDFKNIKKLADLMKSENLKTLEICEKDSRVLLVKHDGGVKEVRTVSGQTEIVANVSNADIQTHSNNGFEVKSPLVGIYYASPSPDSATYVAEGKYVKKGDILCIIEAMKQMNEIVAEVDGKVEQIFVKNGEIVEYDQVLFKIV